ncbi:MAG: hypothetical protein DHS20C19_14440 [Acidimicrobiales bacterium]|nr:MAG: hypothetical protein DHS20C19_14440 [Acidimicrobiales bacterium]
MTDWAALAQRGSRACHDLIGWIYFDPTAAEMYGELGVPDGMGYYVGSRFAPLAGASNGVIGATAYSISEVFLGMGMDLMREHTDAESVMLARDARVLPGLAEISPAIAEGLAPLASRAWEVVDGLHNGARVLFAAHRDRVERHAGEPALSAWLAFNCIREWRGDTHWALIAAADLNGAEVGLIHNLMVDYEEAEWIVRSRGATDEEVALGWARLERKGLVVDRVFTDEARTLRQDIEQRTDEICAQVWEAVGEADTLAFCELLEPHHDAFIARIDATAGKNWMPAARHTHGEGTGV